VSDWGLVQYRRARRSDASAIAALHADSWRHHYRGAYADAFLDGDVGADRLAVWSGRLNQRQVETCAVVGEANGVVVGFAYTIWDGDETWGALLENLHVIQTRKGDGIGTQLLARTAEALLGRASAAGLYLWVLEQNTAAQAFYQARGATCVERGFVPPPGGDAGRLAGTPRRLRHVWPDPAELLLWLKV